MRNLPLGSAAVSSGHRFIVKIDSRTDELGAGESV